MKCLLVLIGPTGVGKTATAVQLAQQFCCPILSADSRQIYQEIALGTAAPSPKEIGLARHYFIGTHTLEETYSAGQYECDAIALLHQLFVEYDKVLLVGGSMLYVDAVCQGIDDIPHADPELRAQLNRQAREEGLEPLLAQLKVWDPVRYAQIDRKNPRRVIHALEVCLSTGRPYSAWLTRPRKPRPFQLLKIGLQLPREELNERINQRVERMVEQGLEEDARRLYPKKELNSLHTVGYKEWFAWWDGKIPDRATVIQRIQRNTRTYAKQQMRWFAKDAEIHWYAPTDLPGITQLIQHTCP